MADALREEGFVALPSPSGMRGPPASLPSAHGDPFDHMLTARAEIENVPLVTPILCFARSARVLW